MQFIYSKSHFSSLKRELQNKRIAATIGNFDGVHLGHQTLLDEVLNTDAESRLVISFAPHPRKILARIRGESSTFNLLTPLRRKFELIAESGVDAFVCIPFRRELSGLSPREFVQRYLLETLNVAHLVVGDEWRFGKGGAGDAAQILSLGKELGFSVDVKQQLELAAERVSSSRIRSLLAETRFGEAKALLGRDFDISGKVVHGAKRGRTLGYPTANIRPLDSYVPPHGVYATRVLVDGVSYAAATNVGVRPVFESAGELLIESHLLDVEIDLYGKRIRVEFVEKLRGEEQFDSVDALKQQMARDVVLTKEILERS